MTHLEAVEIRRRQLQGERIEPVIAAHAIRVIQSQKPAIGRPPKACALQVLALLKASPGPLSAEVIAHRLDISIRSVYRYVKELRQAGHPVEGQQCVGLWIDEDEPIETAEGCEA